MNRIISTVAAAAAFLAAIATTTFADPLQKGGTLRVATQPGAQYAAVYIAKEKGWFEEEFKPDGISVAYSNFKSGPAMIESFVGGGQDIGVIGDTPLIVARAAGIPVKAVSVIGAGAKRVAILVPPTGGATSVAALKGRRIGTPKGTPPHQFLAAALQQAGLTVNDVQLINLPYNDAVAALSAGDVDAVSLVEPYVSDAEVREIGRQLIDGEGLVLGTSLVFASEDFARLNPEIVSRVIKVLGKADAWRKNNPEEAVKILSNETKFSEAALARALPKISTDPRITPEIIADLEKTSTFLKANGLIKSDVDTAVLLNELVDDRHIKAAQLQ